MGAAGSMRWLAFCHEPASTTAPSRSASPPAAAHLPGGTQLPVPRHPRGTTPGDGVVPRPERAVLPGALRAGGARAGHQRRAGAGSQPRQPAPLAATPCGRRPGGADGRATRTGASSIGGPWSPVESVCSAPLRFVRQSRPLPQELLRPTAERRAPTHRDRRWGCGPRAHAGR